MKKINPKIIFLLFNALSHKQLFVGGATQGIAMGAREALPQKAGGIVRARGGQTLSGTASPQPHQRLEPLCGAADTDFDEPKGNFCNGVI